MSHPPYPGQYVNQGQYAPMSYGNYPPSFTKPPPQPYTAQPSPHSYPGPYPQQAPFTTSLHSGPSPPMASSPPQQQINAPSYGGVFPGRSTDEQYRDRPTRRPSQESSYHRTPSLASDETRAPRPQDSSQKDEMDDLQRQVRSLEIACGGKEKEVMDKEAQIRVLLGQLDDARSGNGGVPTPHGEVENMRRQIGLLEVACNAKEKELMDKEGRMRSLQQEVEDLRKAKRGPAPGATGHADHSLCRKVVNILIEVGPALKDFTSQGRSPLHYAAYSGNFDLTDYFLSEGAHIDEKSKEGLSALYFASFHGHYQIVDFLVRHGTRVKEDTASLHAACSRGYLNIAELLLRNGANINAITSTGGTPLSAASANGHAEVVRFLTKEGANVRGSSWSGQNPLVEASLGGHIDIISHLLEHGADVMARDHRGWTPLHGAASEGSLALVKFFLNKGGDPNVKNNQGATPKDLAKKNKQAEVVKFFKAMK